MYKIEETCTPTRVDENIRLKLFSAFQMMHDCDDIDYNHHMNNCCYIRIAQELIPSDFCIKRVRVEYKVAARLGEALTPQLYADDEKYFVELKCERGTCAVIAFE